MNDAKYMTKETKRKNQNEKGERERRRRNSDGTRACVHYK